MIHCVTISPRDPLIARDSRPFGAGQGQRMRSLDWLYPSVVAGSLRTLLGKQKDPSFSEKTVEALKALSVAGPLPVVDDTLFFPQPQDCLVREKDRCCFATRPMVITGEGCDLPPGLQPVLLPDDVQDFKPAKQPAFWNCEKLSQWLIDKADATIPEKGTVCNGFLDAPPQDLRFHIKMDPHTGAGQKEDAFFLTAGLDLSRQDHASPIGLSLRLERGDTFSAILEKLGAFHPLGGERRLAHWQVDNTDTLWACPETITEALGRSSLVRMTLATPAIFSDAWKPGWLNQGSDGLEGSPPSSGLTLRLIGAALNRWQPLSGWSLETNATKNLRPGHKPIRRMVPAGGTYFFEVAEGSASELSEFWLQSVCDEEQDQRYGFGLALWGIWNKQNA